VNKDPIILSETTLNQSDPNLVRLRTNRARKQRRKQRMITSAKVAGLTAGAVTVGVLTAGAGLVAGLGFVGVSSLLGVGVGGAGRAYKRKGDRDITNATELVAGLSVNQNDGSVKSDGEDEIDEGEDGSLGSPSSVAGEDSDEEGDTDDEDGRFGSMRMRSSSAGESGESPSKEERKGKKKKKRGKRRYERGSYVTVGGYDKEQLERWRIEVRPRGKATDAQSSCCLAVH
jgi:hypothetical protein